MGLSGMLHIPVCARGYVYGKTCIFVPGDDLARHPAGSSTVFPQELSIRFGAVSPRIALLALLVALLIAPLPALGEDAAANAPANNEAARQRVSSDEAAAKPKPFVDIVCPLMQQQAFLLGLPAMPFVRLIWKESRFNPNAVSPKGAQGIAQFMPGTAADRGLDDPL